MDCRRQNDAIEIALTKKKKKKIDKISNNGDGKKWKDLGYV